jgi:hypothetical protein
MESYRPFRDGKMVTDRIVTGGTRLLSVTRNEMGCIAVDPI